MAKTAKRRVITTRRIPPPRPREEEIIYEEDGPPLDELQDDGTEDTIAGIVGQFGGKDVQVKVYRIGPHGKSYCYTDGPDVTEESIRSNPYGGHGRFTLQVMIGGELRRSFEINIEPPQVAAGAAPGASPDIQRLYDKISALEARLATPVPSEPMSAVLNAAVGLINSQAVKPVETPMEQVMKMAEFIVQMRNPEKTADDGFDFKGILSGVAKEALPLLIGRGVSPGVAAPPVSSPGPTNEQEAIVADANAMQRQLVQGIAYLKKKCMMGADPALYLDFILLDSENEQFAKLVHLAVTQEFEVFARVDPEIAKPPYDEFFRFIYNGLRSAFAPADSVATDTSRSGGNTANPGANGAARPGKSK